MATTDKTIKLEKIELNSSHLRRNSTGNFRFDTTPSTVVPHYLHASAHSCHNYCKYGNHNTYETKTRNPFPPRFSVTPDKSHLLAGFPNLVPKHTKPVIKTINKYETTKKETPRSSKKVDASQKQTFEPKLLQMKPSTLSSSKSVIRRYSDISIPTKGLGAKEVCPMGSPSSRRNIEMRISKDINSPKASKKSQLAITVPTSPKALVKAVLTKNSGNVQSPRKVSSITKQMTKNYGNVKSPRKVSSITKQKSLRKVEPIKQSIEEDVPEKTLYVIEPIAEKNSRFSLPSPKFDKDDSTKGIQTPESTESKEDRETKILNQKVETKYKPLRVGRMTSDDGDCSPRKLKFRRGTVVTIGSEISSPRKLKFKPGKVLTESQKSRADEKKIVMVKRLISEGAFNVNEDESPKVVLRHQDIEGRKDLGSLYNNVIEETASKLVETRKSKVKALVGAFESIISLQDTKSSDIN